MWQFSQINDAVRDKNTTVSLFFNQETKFKANLFNCIPQLSNKNNKDNLFDRFFSAPTSWSCSRSRPSPRTRPGPAPPSRGGGAASARARRRRRRRRTPAPPPPPPPGARAQPPSEESLRDKRNAGDEFYFIVRDGVFTKPRHRSDHKQSEPCGNRQSTTVYNKEKRWLKRLGVLLSLGEVSPWPTGPCGGSCCRVARSADRTRAHLLSQLPTRPLYIHCSLRTHRTLA